jgi:hypothetical protein
MPPFWTIGTLFGASSVALGAFGAHGLKSRIADPARIANWSTAAQYQVRLAFFPTYIPFPPFERAQAPYALSHSLAFWLASSLCTRYRSWLANAP